MFNGIWLVACESLTIGDREYQAGERFEISRTQSGPLLVMGRARIAAKQIPDPPAPKRRRGRPRKTETPVGPETPQVPTEDAPSQREYQRRDLEAES